MILLELLAAIDSGAATVDFTMRYLERRRIRKSVGPEYELNVIAIDFVKMPEPPGLSGYNGKRREMGSDRR